MGRNRIDALGDAVITISYGHHEVHEGDAFRAQVNDASMANSDTLIVAFKTPAGTKRAHMVFGFSTLVGGNLVVWEGPTWTQGTGAAVDIINRKRVTSPGSSVLLENRGQADFTASDELISNVTGLNTGSAVNIYRDDAFGSQNRLAGASRDQEEYLLKPDAQYALVFTAVGGSNAASIVLNWYEHTDSR